MTPAGSASRWPPSPRLPKALAGSAGALVVCAVALSAACGPAEAPEELAADSVLRSELGLTATDRVHRIRLTSGDREEIRPDSVLVRPGDWVEFVSGDWRVREVRFDTGALAPEGRSFLLSTDQVDSPPLLQQDARFVVSLEGAPPGRYPFQVEGNLPAARGVVVVVSPP